MMLSGKTAVITGCSRGIGRAILENFAFYGADLFAVVRKETEEFKSFSRQIEEKYKVSVTPVYADFREEEEVERAAKEIIAAKRRIDILINNIGMSLPVKMFAMTKMKDMKEVFQVNLFSPLLFTQLISKKMIIHRAGSIVFISSTAVYDAFSSLDYCSSKAAIVGAVRRLAVELGNYGMRVNAVAPSLTETDMGNAISPDDEKTALQRNIFGRKAETKEIAEAVAFLAADVSSFITGQVIRVDGGLL